MLPVTKPLPHRLDQFAALLHVGKEVLAER
jgi:hypothetical protein